MSPIATPTLGEFEEIEKEVNGTNRFVTKSWNKKKNSEGGGTYKILRNGKVFDKVGVKLPNTKYFIALGNSKKDAEQNAAIECLKNINKK